MQQAQLTERYVIMSRAADNGALDGANELPYSDATQQSATELNIHNVAQGDLDALGAEQTGAIHADQSKITTTAAAIPFTVRRSPAEFQLRAEALIQEAGHELIGLYEAKLKRSGTTGCSRSTTVSGGMRSRCARWGRPGPICC